MGFIFENTRSLLSKAKNLTLTSETRLHRTRQKQLWWLSWVANTATAVNEAQKETNYRRRSSCWFPSIESPKGVFWGTPSWHIMCGAQQEAGECSRGSSAWPKRSLAALGPAWMTPSTLATWAELATSSKTPSVPGTHLFALPISRLRNKLFSHCSQQPESQLNLFTLSIHIWNRMHWPPYNSFLIL